MGQTFSILDAGTGSRCGDSKQIDPVERFREVVLDYSVFDGISSKWDRMALLLPSKP